MAVALRSYVQDLITKKNFILILADLSEFIGITADNFYQLNLVLHLMGYFLCPYKKQFNCTINPNKLNVIEIAQKTQPLAISDQEALQQATQTEYYPIIVPPEEWKLPPGAFKSLNCGPT